MIGRKTALALLFALLFCLVPATAKADSRDAVAQKLEAYRQFFVRFQNTPNRAVPPQLLAECHGIILITSYRAGFGIGAEVGGGLIMMHDRATGAWSAPAFIRSAGGSWGFQIGGQQSEAIILVMNEEGVNMLLKNRFSIGVDASAAAGPVGKEVGAGTVRAALLTYSHARGLFAGASLGGGAMLNNDSMNTSLYGRPVTVRDLMNGSVPVPPEAHGLIETLQSFSAPFPMQRQPRGQPGPQNFSPAPGEFNNPPMQPNQAY